MGLDLFRHNREAYDAAVAMLNQQGKTAVIHPTGTGKSFIGFQLCQDHPGSKICWLSPSEYIFQTQLENLKKVSGGWMPDNIVFYTYAKLMLLSPKELEEIGPDYIILDEFHRCGAQMWGAGVRQLLNCFPEAKLLGLSATNIRYLDNQRDMAKELFDGCVASEMSLGEAIVRGILPKPRYVTTVFKYHQSLEQYQKRILNLRVPALRDLNQVYYDSLRRALNQADGLDVVLKKNITNKTGKYLVFCSDFEHLQEMRELTAPWFAVINPEVHSYLAYSSDPETSRAFQNFKTDDSDALKLLFCIDMLNEGVHVKDISGVILFRPTMSPIIYKQQIGRALTSGNHAAPLILDVVNNFEGLQSISAIQKEMEEAVGILRQNGEQESIVTERFEVEEQVHDCARLFEALENSLSTPWSHYFREAEKYYIENHHLNVPKSYETPEGLRLGQWLCTQRVLYRNSRYRLTAEQIKKLESIGMQWQRYEDQCWERNFDAAMAFWQERGHLRVPSKYINPEGLALGKWISNLRTQYRNGNLNLDEEQLQQINDLGMIWDDIEAQWQHHFGCAADFYDRNGHLNVPVNYTAEDGFLLGDWLSQLRTARRSVTRRRLTEAQIAQLDEIGMQWEKHSDNTWMRGYRIAEDHYRIHGNVNVPSTYKTEDGFALGKWVNRQQYAYHHPEKSNTVLSAERIALLEGIGITLEEKHKRNLKCTKRTYRAG